MNTGDNILISLSGKEPFKCPNCGREYKDGYNEVRIGEDGFNCCWKCYYDGIIWAIKNMGN